MAEDVGDKERLRCPACGYTHWNTPTPVLAGVVEYQGQILLARNAAWPNKSMYALITGFMEAGESPQAGISAAGACWVAQQIAARDSNATIVFVVCDRGDRYLSTGVFPA